MIRGAHMIIYTADAEANRAFFRDVLAWPFVDAHDGWGRLTHLTLPGGGKLGIYEPQHASPLSTGPDA